VALGDAGRKAVLFSSARTAYSRFAELFTIGLDGGCGELPLPRATKGRSPRRHPTRLRAVLAGLHDVKRYRGGRVRPSARHARHSRIEKVPREGSNDFNPMWWATRCTSCRIATGASRSTRRHAGEEVARVLDNDGYDIKSASAGPGAIVYEQFGSLGLYDSRPAATAGRGDVAADFPEVRERLLRVGRP